MLKTKSKSEDGMASIELVPLLLLFALLFNFTLGFFGIVHTGILNSIAARNYAFETFRNRSNLIYLRDEAGNISQELASRYSTIGFRFHGITSENNSTDRWIPTQRAIRFTDQENLDETLGDNAEHSTLVRTIQSVGKVSDTFTGKTVEEGKSGVNPVWVQSLYGICLNSTCTPISR